MDSDKNQRTFSIEEQRRTVPLRNKVLYFLISMVWIHIQFIPLIPLGLVGCVVCTMQKKIFKKIKLVLIIGCIIGFIGTGFNVNIFSSVVSPTVLSNKGSIKKLNLRFGVNIGINNLTRIYQLINSKTKTKMMQITIYSNDLDKQSIDEARKVIKNHLDSIKLCKYSKMKGDFDRGFLNPEQMIKIYVKIEKEAGHLRSANYLGYQIISSPQKGLKCYSLIYKVDFERPKYEYFCLSVIKKDDRWKIIGFDLYVPNKVEIKIGKP